MDPVAKLNSLLCRDTTHDAFSVKPAWSAPATDTAYLPAVLCGNNTCSHGNRAEIHLLPGALQWARQFLTSLERLG